MDATLGPLLWRIAGQWQWRPEVLLPVGLAAALYLRGARRLRRAHPARSVAARWRAACYLGGAGAIVIALCSPLELLAELSFSAHMIQHQLLLMVAPPLLLLGEPFPSLVWGLPPRLRPVVGAVVARPGPVRAALRRLTWMPVAGALYTLVLWGWHYPRFYEAALGRPWLHDLEHLTFFAAAILFWWPIVNPAPRLRRLGTGMLYGVRIGYLILATAQNTLLGAVLGLAERVLYPSYAAAPRLLDGWSPVDDQAFGGGVMWSGSHMFLIGVLVLLHRALDTERPGVVGQNEDARPPAVV